MASGYRLWQAGRRAPGNARLGCGEVDEYLFESLADFEAALAGMAAPQFGAHSEALAPFVISGSQHWVIYRVQEQPA